MKRGTARGTPLIRGWWYTAEAETRRAVTRRSRAGRCSRSTRRTRRTTSQAGAGELAYVTGHVSGNRARTCAAAGTSDGSWTTCTASVTRYADMAAGAAVQRADRVPDDEPRPVCERAFGDGQGLHAVHAAHELGQTWRARPGNAERGVPVRTGSHAEQRTDDPGVPPGGRFSNPNDVQRVQMGSRSSLTRTIAGSRTRRSSRTPVGRALNRLQRDGNGPGRHCARQTVAGTSCGRERPGHTRTGTDQTTLR